MFIMRSIAEERPSVGQGIFWKRLAVPVSQLPPPVQDSLGAAMEELQHEGLFDQNEGITEKGISAIYGSAAERTQDAKNAIFQQLRNMQARVGHTPNWRAFIAAPEVVKNALADAIEELQRDGLLDENEALTQKGYEKLY